MTDKQRHYNPLPKGTSDKTITRERVRQIEKMALRKLRHELTMRGIRPDDLLELAPKRSSLD